MSELGEGGALQGARLSIEEAQEVVAAIRDHRVDAFVVEGPAGKRVFTIANSDRHAYALIDEMQQGALTLDENGLVLYANGRFARMVGMRPEKLVASSLLERIAESDRGQCRELLKRARGGRVRGDLHLTRVDRSELPVQVAFEPLQSDSGASVGAIVTDLSTEIAHRRALASEELTRSILEQAVDAIVVCGSDGTVLRCNQAARVLCGCDPMDRSFGSVFPLRSAARVEMISVFSDALSGRTRRGVEVQLERTGGAAADLVLNAGPLRGSNSSVIGVVITLVDISERVRAERERGEAERRFRLLTDLLPGIVWSTDAQGRVEFVNRFWQQYTGLGPEVVHDPARIEKLCHPDDLPAIEEWRRAMREGRAHELLYRVRSKDGELRWFMGRSVPVHDERGASVGCVGAAIDIDPQKRAQEALRESLGREQEARAEAERANRLKDEFVTTLSHELRTPINSILGWAQLLKRASRKEADLAQGLDVIERNARAQSQLIADLLDVQRMLSSRLRLELRAVDLCAVAHAAIESVLPAARSRAVLIERAFELDSVHVSGDPDRLQQIVWNLLTNAVKFTPAGGHVRVELRRASEGSAPAVELRVVDTGVGIRGDFLPHVFDRFRQADASTTRRSAGLGLGLAIVKQLVELHGGSVRAHSDGEGTGATFEVRLPLLVESAAEQRLRAEPLLVENAELASEQVSLAGVRVLMVDDEADARDLARRVLEGCGAEVETAISAEAALACIAARPPDVLISDVAMPEHDGYELIRRVRAFGPERGGDVPAIALTAFARVEDRARALGSGYQSHLTKPIGVHELIATVAHLARTTRGRGDR